MYEMLEYAKELSAIFVTMLVVIIDRFSKKDFYRKLLVVASLPSLIRKHYTKLSTNNVDFRLLKSGITLVIKFYNGIDVYDDRIITKYARSIRRLIASSTYDSLILDLTEADTPVDMKKVEFLIRRINEGSNTKQIRIYKPQHWNIHLPQNINFDLITVKDDGYRDNGKKIIYREKRRSQKNDKQ